jgi:hypothetical protein
MPTFGLPSARAEASRRNGAKSKGPKTHEGKARSAQNALKHGLRAQKHIVLPGERATEFAALEAALLEELAPEGALQTVLARRVVAAAWRLERAEHLEADLFTWNQLDGAGRNLGLALTRDCNGARSFDTLLRYRGGTLAELWRALRTLNALQAEQAAQVASGIVPEARAPAPGRPAATAPALTATPRDRAAGPTPQPDEPESRGIPDNSGRPSDRSDPSEGGPGHTPAWLPPTLPAPAKTAPCAWPIEPRQGQQAESAPSFPGRTVAPNSASLLAGTALASGGRPGGA